MSSDKTEPSLTTSLQGKQRVQCGCARVRVLMHSFGVVQAQRASSNLLNHIIAEIARREEFFHMCSGWFDCTEPPLPTSLQGKQGVKGACALVRGGSSASNLLKPQQRRASEVCCVPSQEFGVVLGSVQSNEREGSAQSNHPERECKNATNLACSARLWFEEVRGGPMRSNHPGR